MSSGWPLAVLGVVIVVALVLGGVRNAAASGSAAADRQVTQLAGLASAINSLAAAMEDEEDSVADYVALGRPATPNALLFPQGQEAVTNIAESRVDSAAGAIGTGFAPSVRTALNGALDMSRRIGAIRHAAFSGHGPALQVIESYSAVTSVLISFDAQVATGVGDRVIVAEVRALSALARAEGEVALERSILDAALTAGHFRAGEAAALSAARTRASAALASFDSAATPGERHSYAAAMAGTQVGYAEQILSQALRSGPDLAVANPPGTGFVTTEASWKNDMTFMVDQMRGTEQGLLNSIEKQSRALQAEAAGTALGTWIVMAVIVVAAGAAGFAVIWRRSFCPAWPPAWSPLSSSQ